MMSRKNIPKPKGKGKRKGTTVFDAADAIRKRKKRSQDALKGKFTKVKSKKSKTKKA